MFQKWHDNHQDDGYASSGLHDNNKTFKNDPYTHDDIPEGAIDEEDMYDLSRERANSNYDFEDWARDNEDDLIDEIELEDDDHKKVDEKLREDHDWDGDNPDFDQELQNHHDKIYNEATKNNWEIHTSKIPQLTGKTAEELGLDDYENDSGMIDRRDIKNHKEEHNASTIGFDDHEEYFMSDHPD